MRKPVWSLRTRLTGLLAFTVSIALGIVFVLVNFYLRNQSLERRFRELEEKVSVISRDPVDDATLRENKEDFPGIELYVYHNDGRPIASTTKSVPAMHIGRFKTGDQLSFGIAFKDRITVGVSSWSETNTGLQQLAFVLLVLWLLLTVVTAFVAWYGSGMMLQPVKELVRSAEKLSGRSTGEILQTSDTAEFAELADRLNQLISRVHQSALLQEQFASDAAHELRNPLAILRTRIEANLLRDRSISEHVESQQRMLHQVDRLSAIVESLLRSARQLSREVEPIDFAYAVTSAVNQWQDLSAWPDEQIQVKCAPSWARIQIDEVEIIVRNLLDNSARYSPSGAIIEISVAVEGERIGLTVRDYGTGIPAKEFVRVFDRFYRSDEARDRTHGGAGIGLAVVKRIVEARGGSVFPQAVSTGTLMVVTLPAETV